MDRATATAQLRAIYFSLLDSAGEGTKSDTFFRSSLKIICRRVHSNLGFISMQFVSARLFLA